MKKESRSEQERAIEKATAANEELCRVRRLLQREKDASAVQAKELEALAEALYIGVAEAFGREVGDGAKEAVVPRVDAAAFRRNWELKARAVEGGFAIRMEPKKRTDEPG